MVTVTTLEVDAESSASPLYAALSEWFPTLSVPRVSIPLPEARLADPIEVLPSRKVSVPVAEAGETVAVSVMDCPETAVVAEAARAAVVVCSPAAAFTLIDTVLDVDDPSAASPAYDAVILWVPAVRVVTVNAAASFDNVAVAMEVVPSSRVTVPEGVEPAAAATVTLNVTDCPALICVVDAERVVVVVAAVTAAGWTTNITAE